MATNKNENTALQTMLEPNCKKLTIEIPYEFTEYLSSLSCRHVSTRCLLL